MWIKSYGKKKNILGRMGIWGEAELILRICGAKENTFYHQCIIFRDQGSTNPGGGGGRLQDEIIFYYVALLCIVLDNLTL